MKKINSIFIAALVFTTIGVTESNAQMTGKQTMESVYNAPSGDDMQGELSMTLINKQGEQRVRKLKQYIKDAGDTEKKIMFFLSPADVKGTSFMNWSYDNGKENDQWIYLPALNRTKRISSEGKNDNFMGSDFTYDDLGDRHPVEDNHTLLREETVNGHPCYVVESKPKENDYIYSGIISWIMKENMIGLKRDFYDEDGDLLKTLTIYEYDKIDGYWTILKTEMKNIQKNHRTVMEFSNVQINQGVPESKFTERSMTMGR
ncbi:MAG: outer membrane lipoprotein-sorting protein [Bacteroidales bacterium]|nr:outer membrane lipoprotein-sorting protein [Bacteroidales bacterium]MDT8431765.1 outer membrane lipoprotein-sorting protein [Bacteroidales bacterium]